MSLPFSHYPRPDILRKLNLERHHVLEASAGTGKTYTLEHILIELIVAKAVSLESVLVVTFTDKATREMRSRIRRKLIDMLFHSDDAAVPTSKAHGFWVLDAEARGQLRSAIQAVDRASISTIHAFCHRALSDFAFESGRALVQEQVEARSAFASLLRDLAKLHESPRAPCAHSSKSP